MLNTLRVKFSERFRISLESLPGHIQSKAVKKMAIFVDNPYYPSLKTHKLHGRYRGSLAYSVDHDYRIIFIFLDRDTVLYLDIGTHDIYK